MKKYLYFLCLSVVLTMLFVYQRDSMFYDNDFSDARNVSTLLPKLSMFVFSFLGVVLSIPRIWDSKVSKRYTLAVLFVYLITIIFSMMYPLASKDEYITVILPLLLFYLINSYSCYFANSQLIVWGITVMVVLLSFNYLIGYTEYLLGTVNSTTASYHILYFLPFLLCHKNKILRILFSIIIFIIVMVSLKRGGVVASVAAITVYLYVWQFSLKGRRLKFWGLLLTILAAAGIAYSYSIVNESLLDGLLSSRFDSISETGGSGRLDIYKDYLDFIFNDHPFRYIIGHGWWGSMRDSSVGVTCHNDFLECFIDFGIFGLVFYILFIVALVKLCKKMIKCRHEYAPAMAASLAMFFMNSMVSHILIYPKFSMIFALFWGFIVSSTRNITSPDNNNAHYENRTIDISRSL